MNRKSHQFTEYLTVTPRDLDWGIQMLDAGYTRVAPYSDYPPGRHPRDYLFTWQQGRVLQEFQVIYITRGEGIFESVHIRKTIKAGTILLLFPNVWHRYKPLRKTGWDEYWVGFNGYYPQQLMENRCFSPDKPVLNVGYDEDLLKLFLRIYETIQEGRVESQPIISSLTIQILAHAYAVRNHKVAADKEIEKSIQKARFFILNHVTSPLNPQQLARDLRLGYSWFRRMFKHYIGLSPIQYQMQLRIQRACRMLSYSGRSNKEIAFDLGFESSSYFTKIFKKKTGLTPQAFRRQYQERLRTTAVGRT